MPFKWYRNNSCQPLHLGAEWLTSEMAGYEHDDAVNKPPPVAVAVRFQPVPEAGEGRPSSNHIRVLSSIVQSHSCVVVHRPITFVCCRPSSNHIRGFALDVSRGA